MPARQIGSKSFARVSSSSRHFQGAFLRGGYPGLKPWAELFCPFGRDFVAGDNLTLGYRATWRLTETEIEFEAIEPGWSRFDAFLSKFVGQIFVLLAQTVLVWGVIVGDQDRIVLDTHIAFESSENVSG